MFFRALFDPFSLLVLIVIAGMVGVALVWYRLGQQHLLELVGGLKTLRRFARDLFPSHPVRRRLESAPVVELSLEEISKIMSGDEEVEPASQGLIRLQDRLAWIERFSQYAIHIGILGTVFALVTSDPTDMASFRARVCPWPWGRPSGAWWGPWSCRPWPGWLRVCWTGRVMPCGGLCSTR